jgi:glycosyltransferase involved in cell wall biosynthesis
MRIWILNHYALPPDRAGGTRHYEFGRLLAGWGHDVTIFASSFSHFSRTEERLAAGERLRVQVIDGVRFIWVRTTPYYRNDGRRMLNMAGYAAAVLRVQHRFARPDVVVGSCVHPMAVAAACLIGAVRRAPFVFEVRDLWPQTLIDMGALTERGPVACGLRAAERFLYHRARLVISLLPGAAEYITAVGVPRCKIIYIPNGIAHVAPTMPGPATSVPTAPGPVTSALADRIRRLRPAEGSEHGLIAGYVGSHGAANGVDVLVQTAAVLRDRGVGDIALVLVGDGPDKERCRQLARDLGLNNILFAPPVPKRAVPGVIQALDVTLFPLRDLPVFRYGLSSNKLFDYLASGRPVICASALADNPVRASGGGICIRPEAPEAVADALVELAAAGSAGRRAIGERGRSWVYQHHDMTALAEQFLHALESVAM